MDGYAAINAIVSPWFVPTRPAALGMGYNGGSIGGVIISPLWVATTGTLGFFESSSNNRYCHGSHDLDCRLVVIF
jgi:hypothetical protein